MSRQQSSLAIGASPCPAFPHLAGLAKPHRLGPGRYSPFDDAAAPAAGRRSLGRLSGADRTPSPLARTNRGPSYGSTRRVPSVRDAPSRPAIVRRAPPLAATRVQSRVFLNLVRHPLRVTDMIRLLG